MEITHIILESVAILIGLYLAFVKSFFQEKGKNLATQQDIAKITQLVEEVKKQYNDDTEYLKSQLNLHNQSFTDIKTLERNALIEINLKYSDWLNALNSFSLIYYSYDNFESLTSIDLFFNEKQLAFNVARDNLHLYLHDLELLELERELAISTMELEGNILVSVNNFISNCRNYNFAKASAKGDEQLKLNREYHDLQKPLLVDGLKEKNKIFMVAYNHQVKFIRRLNKIIYSLIDK
ncbi:hypothetical protein [Mucilaginibacter sp. dw_454]|uniref:hypothetical protein n=1 Tax=Mucilaginibacter sp. dw_454 TaxID=2720079 RepID=UPI001BD4ED35|nr:hypothetical protein [Mucilaginibacter sp. dw_454]